MALPTSKKAAGAVAEYTDERLGLARWLRPQLRKPFPSHWSFLLGEIALYSFVLLLLTGTFLTLFYKPVEAYDSTVAITFDVRGGMLVRQLHHWSATVFVLAIVAHLIRVFFTGAFRRPRELTWMLGVVLFATVLLEAFLGYSLTGDQLAGEGVRALDALLLAIPVAGTYLEMFLFGGAFPGGDIIPRIYAAHILLIPGILAAIIPLHALILTWRQKHTEYAKTAAGPDKVRGGPFFPYFAVKNAATTLGTFAVIALLATFVQVNPVWLHGRYSYATELEEVQPWWFSGVLDGASTLMPGWDVNAFGHTFAIGLWIPMLVMFGFFGVLFFYPFIERRFTGDREYHQLLDRPRDAPERTALGLAVLTFFGVQWAGIAVRYFDDPVPVTWVLRAAVFVLPVLVYVATRSWLASRRTL
ncbi:ubiquinol-cytochrome c reductase cytochrome b subunit [Streptosporangiaceae bacterium NEAU-GS5]|nr:ubiquinol-cytochrome c reductase cytochrome b subunit [Streptosporangiaceae bacterium NEAU-GS5]